MAVTPRLLARLSSLDDLLELVAELGYAPGGDELNAAARTRLGLDAGGLGVRRAAIVARRGSFAIYGLVATQPGRSEVSGAAERLARATPGERNLLLVLDAPATTLAVAALAPHDGGFRARQLRVSLDRPSPVSAEILSGLAARPHDTALALAVRAAEVLTEEGLTQRFFRDFARLHSLAAERLAEMPRATPGERRSLSLVILTRVLFLYFVQARGWLGGGRRDYLASLLDASLERGRPFHRGVFEPLCFGALNSPPGRRPPLSRALGDLPFLNGGLFERQAIERRYPRATLDNETWRLLFDELFERFHFTVRERDEVDAVDPEMLGRVFEGLMARDLRRAQGTYFTPRELLRETVQRTLAAALQGRDAERLRRIRILDPAVGSGAFLLEALIQLEQARARLVPDERPAERRRSIVRDNLFGVDLDPMAVRLTELRLWLALVVHDDARLDEVAPLPNLDQNLRQGDSLISPLDLAGPRTSAAAARIRAVAERRLAYFGAIGSEKAGLARAIRADERSLALEAADAGIASLTARLADVVGPGRDLFGRRAARRPATTRRVHAWRRERRELIAARRRIVLEERLPFFSYDVHFAHVMAEGGFDVVVGNPPWIRGERLPLTLRAALSERFAAYRAAAERKGFAHLPDLSVAFVERSLALVRPGGVVGFLVPGKLLRAGYAGPLRSLIRRTATVVALADRAHDARTGFAATVFPLMMVLRKEAPAAETPAETSVVGASGRRLVGAAAQRDLGLDEIASRAPWLALPGDMVRAIRQVLRAGPRLGSAFRPTLGVKTGANDIFVRDATSADELPRCCRVPAIQGRDVSPFAIRPRAWLLAALADDGTPLKRAPEDVVRYLAPFASRLARRADDRGAAPWTLFRTDMLRSPYLVIWRDIAPRLEAAALRRDDAGSPVPLNTCYGVAAPDAYTASWLAAYLNSGPLRNVAAALAERASGGAFRFSAAVVGALPLPPCRETHDVRRLAAVAEAAAHGEEWSPDDLDTHAGLALGLAPEVLQLLAYLGDALRRDAGGHR